MCGTLNVFMVHSTSNLCLGHFLAWPKVYDYCQAFDGSHAIKALKLRTSFYGNKYQHRNIGLRWKICCLFSSLYWSWTQHKLLKGNNRSLECVVVLMILIFIPACVNNVWHQVLIFLVHRRLIFVFSHGEYLYLIYTTMNIFKHCCVDFKENKFLVPFPADTCMTATFLVTQSYTNCLFQGQSHHNSFSDIGLGIVPKETFAAS